MRYRHIFKTAFLQKMSIGTVCDWLNPSTLCSPSFKTITIERPLIFFCGVEIHLWSRNLLEMSERLTAAFTKSFTCLVCDVVGFVYISVLLNCSELAYILSFNVKFGPTCLPLFSAAIAQAIPLNIHTPPPLTDDFPFSAVLQK